ncbi:hypothetical protein C8F01DRAFT_1123433 [Mycena amicta]|nr:hypothetical protein C8F01DRAFT_1123433 [Mycena amicta]
MTPARLFGWSSSSADGDNVNVPSAQASGQFTFQVLPPGSPSAQDISSPGSRRHQDRAPPRPRNQFILFRLDYVHQHHSLHTSKQRRGANKSLGRTVSGRAAEAWSKLGATERARYAHLAELEKEQHARKYPGYQYRPRRKQPAAANSRRRQPAAARSRPAAASVVDSPPPPKRRRTRHPAPSSTSDYNSSAEESSSFDDGASAQAPPSSPESDYHLQVDAATKADRRRSSSVPVTLGEHDLYLANAGWPASVLETATTPANAPERERERSRELHPTLLQTKRRSRSVTQIEMAGLGIPSYTQQPQVGFFFSFPLSTADQSSQGFFYSTPFRVQSPRPRIGPDALTLDPAALFMSTQVSPLGSASSSLANWNGEASSSSQTPARSPSLSPIAPLPLRIAPPTWLPTYQQVQPPPQWPLDMTGHFVPMPTFTRSMSDPGVGGELAVALELQQQQAEYERAAKEQDDAVFATYFSLSGLELDDDGSSP